MKLKFFQLVLALISVAVMTSACGKKGPPIPRPVDFSAAVRNFNAAVEVDSIVFSGEGYGKNSHLESVSGCIVQHARYPAGEKPCRGCPVDYRESKRIEGPVLENGAFSCRMPWKGNPGIHFFRVSLLGPGDETGPPSEAVSVELRE